MRNLAVVILFSAIVVPGAIAQSLPDLGGTADAALSPQLERRIGESIVRDIRAREPTYLDDPEIEDYLNNLGARLVAVAPGARNSFEFFLIRDSSINAFALPGGFVGVHTGLISAADSESELASVLAHEITHVTQRHIARLLGQQQKMQIPTMVALAAAILLGRNRPDLAVGAATALQAGVVQSQISYTRDFEREADRIGFQTLTSAGFDGHAMPEFFEKMQRFTRVQDDGSTPTYLRTHPVTTERIADAQNRIAGLPYRQKLDSADFQLVRAKLRAQSGEPSEAVSHFEGVLKDRRYASESAARYGLAVALLRQRRAGEALAEVTRLAKSGVSSPMIDTLEARAMHANRDSAGALRVLQRALARYPNGRTLIYAYIEALQEAGRNQDALAGLVEPIRLYPHDPELYTLQAKTYAALGKRALQHQSQAEVYVLRGSLPAAIEQLQLARSAGDGDFYQLSVVDARLKELRARHTRQVREERQERR